MARAFVPRLLRFNPFAQAGDADRTRTTSKPIPAQAFLTFHLLIGSAFLIILAEIPAKFAAEEGTPAPVVLEAIREKMAGRTGASLRALNPTFYSGGEG
jgi:hypothetical protein